MQKKNALVIALALLAISGLTTAKGQDDGWTAIKTGDGILFVWNHPTFSFTLSIKGKDIQPLNDPDHIFFSVDGFVFQIQSLPVSNFLQDQKRKGLDDRSVLAAHREWESKFIEELLKKKLAVQSSSEKLNGSDVLIWQFDVPEGLNSDAKKQLYLTVVSKDYVLLLNGVVTAAISESVARKFLLDTLATLKVSSTPISVKELQESIRKGSGP